jgi:hypothetical protein
MTFLRVKLIMPVLLVHVNCRETKPIASAACSTSHR